MRMICLHGVGSSASIAERQFEPMIKAADPSYEFVFVDGPNESFRGPGMGSEFDGPFWSHTESYTPQEMEKALDHLADQVDELGPFDGIIGFSQGAATAISYMKQQKEMTGEYPFGFGLFFSTVAVFSSDTNYAKTEIKQLAARKLPLTKQAPTDGTMTLGQQKIHNALANTIVPSKYHHVLQPDLDLDRFFEAPNAEVPRLMLPELVNEKLGVPSFHIHGKKEPDFIQQMSKTARALFEPSMMKTAEHSGDHHPPNKSSEVSNTVRALEWCISQANKISIGR